LLGIEGLAIGVGLDPDRCLQRLAPTAVNRRGRNLRREVLDELKSGVRFSIASDGIALHGVSLLVDGHAVLFHRARTETPTCGFSMTTRALPYEDAYPRDLFVKRAQP
jgi:hypothetical protein